MPPEEKKTSLEDDLDQKTNMWQNILNTVTTESQMSDKTLLVLGDQTSGKSSLMSKFAGRFVNEHSRKYVMDYSYVDVVNKDETQTGDVVSRLNIWQLNNEQHTGIACSMLGGLENLAVMITFDLSEPWGIFSSLEKWMKVVESISEKLSDSVLPDDLYDLKKKLSAHIQFYFDPSNSEDTVRLRLSEQEKSEIEIQMKTPKINFGIPIFLVGCKSDALQKRYDPTQIIEKFETLSFLLRKYCLKYGASLFYTTVSGSGKNVDVLQEYIIHRMYNFEFEIPPKVVGLDELSSIFVPSGWDNDDLIIATRRRGDEEKNDGELLDSYFPKPPNKSKNRKQEKKVTAEKNDIFLKTLKFELERAKIDGLSVRRTTPRKPEGPRRQASAASTIPKRDPRRPRQARPGVTRQGSRQTGDKDNNIAVRNFFQSLLKDRGDSSRQQNLRKDAMKALESINQTSSRTSK